MKLLLDTLLKKSDGVSTPIWLMRQAGRYLPEYMVLRKEAGSFLNLCYNPTLASEVTIQPIKRFGLDGAIIFSDILVVPDFLGLKLEFLDGEGPKLENIKEIAQLKNLIIKDLNSSEKMQKICDSISITKSKLDKKTSLIGFAGSPWTVSTYILSEKRNDFSSLRLFVSKNKILVKELIDILIEQTIIYLKAQIEAGVEIIQLFDSWAGVLNEQEFQDYVILPNKKIVKEIKKYDPNIPIIGFPRGAGHMYKTYADQVNVDAISLDQNVPINLAKEIKEIKIVQGNLEPLIMLSTDKEDIKIGVDRIMSELYGKDFIFNLGHGIIKETPVENVEFLVNYVKNWKK